MTSYYLAPSLAALRAEVDAAYPDRDKSSDGWIGDTSHAARPSDHNPDWTAGGVVRAIDVDSNGVPGVTTPLVERMLEATIGDDRVWYVIWNRKIYSRTYNWAPRDYTGSNPHDHHVHVSIQHTSAAQSDTELWLVPEKPVAPAKPARSPLQVIRDAIAAQIKAKPKNKRRKQKLRKARNQLPKN